MGGQDLPRIDEDFASKAGPLRPPKMEAVIAAVHKLYAENGKVICPGAPFRNVPIEELRCQVCAFHYGMKERDPVARVLFHSTKGDEPPIVWDDGDAKPLRHKVFLFWNPEVGALSDEVTLRRLTAAFAAWADRLVDTHLQSSKSEQALSPPRCRGRAVVSPNAMPVSPVKAAGGIQPLASASGGQRRRPLRINASCTDSIAELLAGNLPKKV
eukprot:TRINITY_DN16641_c0_g1_i1.p1 TRINITY_DN16641_c0_g1~~TRINITY_DN16641_c0_g1_i1.p1  ORF type:complete len:213 (+),score=48.24 TRINITY_DN16641_c0_g1_i1:150-788(+)